jgi:hypothetical protein
MVRVTDKELLLARFCSTWQLAPLMNIREWCKDSLAIQAFYDDGKYLIKPLFIPTMIAVGTEE